MSRQRHGRPRHASPTRSARYRICRRHARSPSRRLPERGRAGQGRDDHEVSGTNTTLTGLVGQIHPCVRTQIIYVRSQAGGAGAGKQGS